MVDPDQSQSFLTQLLCQPLGNSAAGPIFSRTRRRLHFDWCGFPICHVNAQAPETRRRCLSPGIVDANVAVEAWCGAHPKIPSRRIIPTAAVIRRGTE